MDEWEQALPVERSTGCSCKRNLARLTAACPVLLFFYRKGTTSLGWNYLKRQILLLQNILLEKTAAVLPLCGRRRSYRSLAFMVGAILGVPEEDLYLDYEFTSLSTYRRVQGRSGEGMQGLLKGIEP